MLTYERNDVRFSLCWVTTFCPCCCWWCDGDGRHDDMPSYYRREGEETKTKRESTLVTFPFPLFAACRPLGSFMFIPPSNDEMIFFTWRVVVALQYYRLEQYPRNPIGVFPPVGVRGINRLIFFSNWLVNINQFLIITSTWHGERRWEGWCNKCTPYGWEREIYGWSKYFSIFSISLSTRDRFPQMLIRRTLRNKICRSIDLSVCGLGHATTQ